MQDECQACDVPDWASLPAELLRRIFGVLLAPGRGIGGSGGGPDLPLLPVARQWFALRLTCSAWSAALEGQPVAVEACVPVPWVLPWLHSHATALRLVSPPEHLSMPARTTAQQAFAWVQDRCGRLCVEGAEWAVDLESPQVAARIAYEEYVCKLATGTTEHTCEPCRSFSFQSSLFVPAGTHFGYDGSYAPLPMLVLSSLQRLQVLDIACGYRGSGSYGTHTFDAAALSRLPRLHTLVLRGFEEPCLWGLPRSLRVLRTLGGQRNDTRHNPVRYPRHFWALPAYSRLDEVELVGYNRDYCEAGYGSAETEPLTAGNVVQLFHSKRRFKVLLTSLCRQSTRVRTDADVLHMSPPDPVLTTKRWLPPDHGLEVFASGDLDPVLEALANAVGSAPHLHTLQLAAGAWFALPCGALVPAAALATAQGRQLLRDRWPRAGVQLSRQGEGGASWLTLTWQQKSQ